MVAGALIAVLAISRRDFTVHIYYAYKCQSYHDLRCYTHLKKNGLKLWSSFVSRLTCIMHDKLESSPQTTAEGNLDGFNLKQS